VLESSTSSEKSIVTNDGNFWYIPSNSSVQESEVKFGTASINNQNKILSKLSNTL
jgi:hypothetical protein